MDTSKVLDNKGHGKFQMLIKMLVWVVRIGRIDVAHPTSSLSRFTACPWQGHLKPLFRIFGYFKKRPNRRVVVHSWEPIYEGGQDSLDMDYTMELGDLYPEAHEEIGTNAPVPLVKEKEITVFVGPDHAHDQAIRKFITGIVIFVGQTPVFYFSKRQGAISTSTYGAEFCVMKTAVKELIAVCYMLRCLGVKVLHASLICGDNIGVIQNCTIKDSHLKKKHIAIAYHKMREAAASGIGHPIKPPGTLNYADCLTKCQTLKCFATLISCMMSG
jgi:hypothetical protein